MVSVSSPTMTEKELYDVAYYELRNRLQAIQGVIAPAVYGGVLRRILAYVDPVKLAARGLSPMDVINTLQKQSVFIPTGNAKFGDIDYQIVSNAMTETVEEMNDLPIRVGEDGAVVFLRDVGTIKDSHQIQSNKVRINGSSMAYIPIYRQPGANTLAIVDSINDKLERINLRLRQMDPKAKDLVLGVVMDQSTPVRASVQWIQISAALGALLAGLVVLVCLRSVRLTLVVFLAIPLSILAALIGLFYTGDTLNSMTLGGLALAIGILVDQSIVVLDNIVRHFRKGKSRIEAARDGTLEVALPVLVSTITFVIVFFPVVFLTGILRFLFESLAITVTTAVVDSSATLVPSLNELPPTQLVRDDVDVTELLDIAIAFRPDLKSVRSLVEVAAAESGSTWWGAYGPQFAAGYQYGGITGHADNIVPATGIPSNLVLNPASPTGSFSGNPLVNGLVKEGILRGSRRLGERDDQTFSFSDQQRANVGLSFRWSLAAFGTLKASRASQRQQMIEAERMLDQAGAQVIRAAQASKMNRELIGLARRQVEAANEALRLSEANLRAGTMTTLDVLQAQDAVNRARVRYADAVVRYNQSQVNLLAAIGLLDKSSLAITHATDDDTPVEQPTAGWPTRCRAQLSLRLSPRADSAIAAHAG